MTPVKQTCEELAVPESPFWPAVPVSPVSPEGYDKNVKV